MKKRIYSLLVSLFLMGTATVQVFGENARFFPANSIRCTNVITVNFAEMDETIPKETIYYEMWTGNDTIVDGKSCVTLWYQYDRDITTITNQPHKAFTPELKGVIYEADNGYVYFKYLNGDSNDWEFLYDFSSPNRKEGETICLGTNDEEETVYETIDQIRTCTLHNGSEVQVVKGLMYGIGYQNYPFFYPNYMWQMLNAYTPIYDPVNFYRNGELLWGTPYDMHSKLVANEQDLDVDGKKWHIRTQVPYIDDRYTNDVFMWVEGDTVVEDIRYKKLYKQTRNVKDSSMGTIEVGYCRQEGNKYYQNGELMFDFGLQEGHEFYPQKGEPLTVKRVGNIMLDDGILRKYLMVVADAQDPDTVYNADYWVEGIGSLRMGILTNDFQSSGVVKELQSCSCNGKYIYNKEESDPSRPTIKCGYGIYHGDTYLYRYTINEAEAVTDSTDFAQWNDKTVIYFDVDTVGTSAFTNAAFRQGQILYFTERLNCIMPDAFTDILMVGNEQAEENPFGDLCIVFSGKAPSIEKSSISNYADTTFRITYVVPDLAAYIENDIQWTYSQLVTIDDFVRGYVSPENEVSVSDSTEVDVTVEDNSNQNTPTDGAILRASVRPRGDIPVRIGEGENKDIYSRAPAWQRYTVEVVVTDCHADTLYTASQECRAHGQCDFVIELPCYPNGGYVYLHSRSIDMFGHATDWNRKKVYLLGDEYEGDYVTDANVDLNNTADAAELTATVDTDSIRITGYYMSNCGGGLYCVVNARGNYIELVFHDGASANCIEYHYVDFMIPRFSEEIKGIDVVEPYPLKVNVVYSSITDIDASDANAPYYDLMGRKVANPTRGIYIRNGRKVVVAR